MPTALEIVLSIFNTGIMAIHRARRTLLTPDQPKTRILYYVGYAPGEYGIYDIIYTEFLLPLYLLLFTTISHFAICEVNYVAHMIDSMVTDKVLPRAPARTSLIDIYLYTYVHLLAHSLVKNGTLLPSVLTDTLHADIDKINTICRTEDDESTQYAVITYSLGSYVYEHSFTMLDARIQDRIVYEGYVGQPTLVGTLLGVPVVRPNPRIFRHLIESAYDVFTDHRYIIPIEANLHVTSLWYYYPVSFISCVGVHLVLWVDPIGLWSIVRQLSAQVHIRKKECDIRSDT